jgi:tRNA uracil 4-sulfurtransferase
MKFLLRLSPDLTIKADKTRRRFLRILLQNLRDAFVSEGIVARVEPGWVRLLVEADDERAGDVARRVFGVHSVSRVDEHARGTLEELVETATPFFLPGVTGKAFAVRARTGGSAPFRARDIEVALGAELAPHGKVRLVNPEVTCHVEVREGHVYLFHESLPAWRGLPIGSEGRAIALISGGFDSAVAAWMMLRRGVSLDYVFCRLGGPTHQLGALRVLQVLGERWSYGDRSRIHVVPFEGVVDAIRAAGHPSFWQLVLKRFMYRAAASIARERRAHAIITGESLGQVSSQTLRNLRALEGRLELPLLRPLVGMDKEEIIARSRDIGTYDISATVQEYCDIVPDKPATGASSAHVASSEAAVKVDLGALLASRVVFELRHLDPQALSMPGHEIDTIPPGAVVLDLRNVVAYRGWHYPEALHLELAEGLKLVDRLDRGKTYVCYCEIGLKSAHLAYRMREHGLDAYNFRGGLKALLRFAAVRDLVPLELIPGLPSPGEHAPDA